MMDLLTRREKRIIEDPGYIKVLFNDVRFSILWLVARLWLGWMWMDLAINKVRDAAWVDTGDALKRYWETVVAAPDTLQPTFLFGWYHSLVQYMLDAEAYTWFAKVVAYGELLVAFAMIIGAFVGIAAFFGAIFNWNAMVASAASANPLLLVVAIGLMFAWKISGFIGADYFLLNLVGTPWKRDKFEDHDRPPDRAPIGAVGD